MSIRNHIVSLFVTLALTLSSVASAATFNLFQPANGILVGNPSTYVTTAATSSNVIALWSGTCNSTSFLRGDGSCQVVAGGPSAANPTGTVGLTAVNGAAATFLRSDGAPALSQAIVPTWTGLHTWSNATPALRLFTTGAATDRKDIRLESSASGQLQLNSYTDAGSLMNSLLIASRASGGFTTATFGSSNGSNTLLGSSLNLATAGGTKFSINSNGQATFAQPGVGGATVTINGPSVSGLGLYLNAGTGAGISNGVQIDAGTNSSDQAIIIQDGAGATNFLTIDGAGSATMGNAATPQGPGTLNVTGGFYVNGVAVGGGTPGGSTTQVQYNNAGAFAGDAGMTYVAGTDTLSVGTVTAATAVTVAGQNVCQANGTNCPAAYAEGINVSHTTSGFSSLSNDRIDWIQNGRNVCLYWNILGTSNANTLTVSGGNWPASTYGTDAIGVNRVVDAAAAGIVGRVTVGTAGPGTLSFSNGMNAVGGGFTASSTKAVQGSMCYLRN